MYLKKRKKKENQKAELDAKEDTLKSKNHQLAEENKRLQDVLDGLKKDNIRLKEEYASTKNALIGKLTVTLNEGRGLLGLNLGGKSADPYVKLRLDKLEYKSKKKPSTLTPKFEQSFEFFVSDKRSEIEISVMNWERVRSDRLIGKCCIKVSDLNQEGKEETKWVPIFTEASRKSTLKRDKSSRNSAVEKEEEHTNTNNNDTTSPPTSPTSTTHAEPGKPAGELSLTFKFVLGN